MRRWRGEGPALPLSLIGLTLALSTTSVGAQLAPIDPRATAPGVELPLRLEVLINGVSTNLVEPFVLGPDGRLSAAAADLKEAGIRCAPASGPRDAVDLASLPDARFVYDAVHQMIDFSLRDAARLARVYDARAGQAKPPPPSTDWGALVNYTLFGSSMDRLREFPVFQGFNATLDAGVFGPYGTVRQTMIAGDTIGSRRETLRLDTTYRYSDPTSMITGEAGDLVSGGLAWTRPFRFGGVQVQRDFGLRPDLVTQPLPNLSGSAAVPSTIDVFLNGAKAFSQPVGAGPYAVTNLPIVSGNGVAHVVVTDATGQQTETALPFFTTPRLLAPGLVDFTAGGGVARRGYGVVSDGYGSDPLGTASLRRGMTDRLTLEGHAEGGAGLVQGGIGAVAGLGAFGTLSGALSGSHLGRAAGGQVFAEYAAEFAGFTLQIGSQRTLGRFDDIGSVTATGVTAANPALGYAAGDFTLDPRPARALDRVTLDLPSVFDRTSLSMSLVHLVEASGRRSRLVTASLSRPLPYDASLFATAYADAAGGGGGFLGLSIPLGDRVRATAAASVEGAGRYGSLDVGQALDRSDGSVGWRVRDLEGDIVDRSVETAYRSPYGTAAAELGQSGRQLSARGSVDGAFGYLHDGGFFVGNRAEDGFAVVDAGVGDVPVYQDNRLVGRTNPWGKLLVSDLRAYDRNQVSIDPLALPVEAEARSTRQIVTPAAHGGVGVDFGVDRHIDAALVRFQNDVGRPLPVGARGHLAGGTEAFVIGYSGQAYIKHLAADNTVSIDLGQGDCSAAFAYRPEGKRRETIGPVTCR